MYANRYHGSKQFYISLKGQFGGDISEDARLFELAYGQLLMRDIINCLLVKNGIRNAYLIQVIDISRDGRKIDNDTRIMSEIFGMGRLDVVWHNRSILISTPEILQGYKGKDYDHEALGEFISYPCAGDFSKYHNHDYDSTPCHSHNINIFYDEEPRKPLTLVGG